MFLFITFNLINLANTFQGKQGDIICEQIVAKLATRIWKAFWLGIHIAHIAVVIMIEFLLIG